MNSFERGIREILTFGIGLAKKHFAVRGVDEASKPALVRSEAPSATLREGIAQLPWCLIGMQAFTGAHQALQPWQSHAPSGAKGLKRPVPNALAAQHQPERQPRKHHAGKSVKRHLRACRVLQ